MNLDRGAWQRPLHFARNEVWVGENWTKVRQQLMEGTYRPQPVRRKTIPKPGGKGERLLGIPNVLDRLIQQAIVQVLTPIFDPSFSESSFGFRPNRSAHGAAKQVQRIIQQGHAYCIDVDLSKFFDRCQHDVLMSRVFASVKRFLTQRLKLVVNEDKSSVRLDMAIKHAVSRKKYWRMSRTPELRYAMTNKWLEQQGLVSLKKLWYERASLCGTA